MCIIYWYVYILFNTLKAIGNFDGSADYIRGRIHLCDIADNYTKNIKLKADKDKSIADALKTTAYQTIDVLKTRRKRIMILKVKIISVSALHDEIVCSKFNIFFDNQQKPIESIQKKGVRSKATDQNKFNEPDT